MSTVARTARKTKMSDRLTEAYEVRAFRNEDEDSLMVQPSEPEIVHAEQGELQNIKSSMKGHGEQLVLPDDCQFGDNDLCFVES